MILKSFSKINLSLSINKRLSKNNLHQIQSYYCLVNVFDTIKIKKIKGKKDIIKFKGRFSKNVNNKNNSVKKTIKILRKAKLIPDNYSILIDKKVPVFSGMGGGTSNSATLLNYFTKGRIKKKLLNNVKEKIGSDLQLFTSKQGFLINLEQVKNFKKRHKFHFLIVYPNIKCSTGYIYSKVNKYSSIKKFNNKNTFDKNKFINFLKNQRNDLQIIVEKKHSVIKKLNMEIKKLKGCYFSRMSGSGSACYGIFNSQKSAKIALKKIKLIFPNYWYAVAKTV